MAIQKIFFGADHGAFELKQALISRLSKSNYEIHDLGTNSLESCDYPDYVFPVADKVSKDPKSVGVVMCKSGIGASIVANKVPGIRAALCRTVEQAILSRRHNNANVLALGANDVSAEEAQKILEAWVKEPFEGGRHERRLEKIKKRENS